MEAGECLDRDGKRVANGGMYMPETDPCVNCRCENGRVGVCSTVVCARPRCEDYITSRDVCCHYTCPGDVPPSPNPLQGISASLHVMCHCNTSNIPFVVL